MKQILEYFPLILFFVCFKLFDIYAATIALMVSITAQVLILRIIEKKFSKKHLAIMAIAIVFGGLTLILRDPIFVKWKATMITWGFAIGFLISDKIFNKNPIKPVFEDNINAPEHVWAQASLIFVASFVLQGALNLYVAFNFDEAIWVNFKVFGLLGITFVTAIFAVTRLFPYFTEEASEVNQESESGESK